MPVKDALRDPANLTAALGYYRHTLGRRVQRSGAGRPSKAPACRRQPIPTLYLHGADDGCLPVPDRRCARQRHSPRRGRASRSSPTQVTSCSTSNPTRVADLVIVVHQPTECRPSDQLISRAERACRRVVQPRQTVDHECARPLAAPGPRRRATRPRRATCIRDSHRLVAATHRPTDRDPADASRRTATDDRARRPSRSPGRARHQPAREPRTALADRTAVAAWRALRAHGRARDRACPGSIPTPGPSAPPHRPRLALRGRSVSVHSIERSRRATFVSTMASSCSNANTSTARAVYGPMPGSARARRDRSGTRAVVVFRDDPRARCRFTARRL